MSAPVAQRVDRTKLPGFHETGLLLQYVHPFNMPLVQRVANYSQQVPTSRRPGVTAFETLFESLGLGLTETVKQDFQLDAVTDLVRFKLDLRVALDRLHDSGLSEKQVGAVLFGALIAAIRSIAPAVVLPNPASAVPGAGEGPFAVD